MAERILDMHSCLASRDDHEFFATLRDRGTAADPEECLVEPTLRRLDVHGVETAVVWKIGRSTAECAKNNEFVADVAASYPDRFIPFATVFPPDVNGALKEIDRSILDLGMAGIKVHPNVMNFSLASPELLLVIERVKELQIPFVTHLNGTLVNHLNRPGNKEVLEKPEPELQDASEDVAARYAPNPNSDPTLLSEAVMRYDSPRFQCAHMGGLLMPWAHASAVTFQTAGASRAVIQWAVDNLSSKRVVFGSDFPFFLLGDEIAKVEALAIPDEAKAQIFWDNAVSRVLR